MKCKICGYEKTDPNYVLEVNEDGFCSGCEYKYATRKDNYSNPRMDYVNKIQAMNDERLFNETKSNIWLSAYASNNPRSDYHWQCDLMYSEWERRGKMEKYGEAHKEVRKAEGF